ncbi:MAG: histidine phosphotransferase family protein [Marinovum sp.]|nr:histidine phosphotransferase family protein [Marinovum sp.]
MHDHRTQLATLIASRICHDLISPVGAISNGLELVALGGAAPDGPELNLISESCDNANARIRFFRVAYGAANDTAQMASHEVRNILDGMTRGGRLSVAWAPNEDCSRADVQLAFLGVQCVETALRRGGKVTISIRPGRIELAAEAERITPDPALWHHLSPTPNGNSVMGEGLNLAAAHVQFALLPMLAADRGRKPAVQHDEGRLLLVI